MAKIVARWWILISLLFWSVTAVAAERKASDAVLNADQVAQIIDNTIVALQQDYLFPSKAELAVQRLHSRRLAGEFDRPFQFDHLRQKLEQILISATGDSRFELRFDPAALLNDSLVSQQFESNVTVSMLAKDIGYLALQGDFVFPESVQSIDHAFSQLKGVKALIIDIRDAHTGSIMLSEYILKWFVPAHSYLATISTSNKQIEHLYTPGNKVTAEFLDIPVFVLQSSFVAGPWELFSHSFKELGRATVVGYDSMGVSVLTKSLSLSHQVSLVLPYAQITNELSGNSWNQFGVIADYPATVEESFAVATELAQSAIGSLD